MAANAYSAKIITILILISITIPFTAAAEIKYYAYGDSLTYPDWMYIMQMRDNNDPTALADHNPDGSGQGSAWALRNLLYHYNTSDRYVFIMFVTNDARGNYGAWQTAANLGAMYKMVKARNSTPIIVMPPLANESRWNVSMRAYIAQVQTCLDNLGISYVKGYDALDSIPGNGQMDYFVNNGMYFDDLHLSVEGHKVLGNYVYLHPPPVDWTPQAAK